MQHPPSSAAIPGGKRTKTAALVSVKSDSKATPITQALPVTKATLAPQHAAPVQPMLIIVPPKKPRPDASFHRKARKLKVVSETP